MRTEHKKATIIETERSVKQFRKELDQLKRWLSSAKVKMVRAQHDDKVASQFVLEVKNRKKDLDHFNLLASQLQHRNALCGQEMALNLINADWDDIMQGVKGLTAQNGNGTETRNATGDGDRGKLFAAPGSPLTKSAPVEVATREKTAASR